MEVFEFSDEKENKYLEILKTLNQEQLAIVKKLDKAKFEKLLNKPQNEISQFLIQAQIDELEAKGLGNLTNDERGKYSELSDNLIAVKKSETKHNKNLITTEKSETAKNNDLIDAKLKAQDKKIAELRGVLLYNPKIRENSKIQTIHGFFDEYEKTAQNPNNLNGKKLEQAKQNKLDDIISFLKNP